jgi:hypothetical protein
MHAAAICLAPALAGNDKHLLAVCADSWRILTDGASQLHAAEILAKHWHACSI